MSLFSHLVDFGKSIAQTVINPVNTAAFGVGGATGEQAVSGGKIKRGVAADAAGLAAGYGIAASGLAGNSVVAAAPSGAGVTAGTTAAGTTAGGTATSGTLAALKTVATVLSPIASLIGAASGIQASKALANSANAPTAAPPVTMPILGGPNTIQTIQGSLESQLLRRGRASTILTAQGSKLGA